MKQKDLKIKQKKSMIKILGRNRKTVGKKSDIFESRLKADFIRKKTEKPMEKEMTEAQIPLRSSLRIRL